MSNLTGKQRLWTIIAIAWILLWLYDIQPWEYTFPHGSWNDFLITGICPVALIGAIIWIRIGFLKDKNKNKKDES
jgi:hypothetical protein